MKPNFTHYASRPGESLPLLQRIVGKWRLKPPPCGRKRAASEDLEAEMPKQGKKVSPGGSATTGTLTASCPPTSQPSTEL